jgi:hypothetical protein
MNVAVIASAQPSRRLSDTGFSWERASLSFNLGPVLERTRGGGWPALRPRAALRLYYRTAPARAAAKTTTEGTGTP